MHFEVRKQKKTKEKDKPVPEDPDESRITQRNRHREGNVID